MRVAWQVVGEFGLEVPGIKESKYSQRRNYARVTEWREIVVGAVGSR